MPVAPNPQRVALARSADGRTTVYIEREWLRFLLGTTGSTSEGGAAQNITRDEFDALVARVSALEDAVSTLQTAFAGLLATVNTLENFDPDVVLYDEQGRALLDPHGRVLTSG